MPARPSTLNPNVRLDEVSILVGRSIFSHLLALNESGRLLPELAETWSVTSDGLTYTFNLRRGVRWHDGQPFTSADVKWTLETMKREGYGGKDALAPLAQVDTPDTHTAVIRLHHAWAPFASDLSGLGLAILPRHVYEGSDWQTNPANEKPIGTGPFRFEGWAGERTLVLTANTNYYRPGPYVQRVLFQHVEPDDVGTMMLAGQADYTAVRPTGIDLSAPPEPLATRVLPTAGRYYLSMNLRRAPLDDVRVRRAIAVSINRLDLVSRALSGLGAPAIGWYTPDVEWAYNGNARVPEFDVARGGLLMDQAGWPMKGRQRVRLRLTVPNAPPIREIADNLREQLAVLGIAVDIERMPTGDWPRRILIDKDFDLTIVSGNQGPDPDQLRRRFLAGTETGDYIGYDAADFRDAVERGARVMSVADRAAAYHRAQEILARDVPIVPLAEGVRVVIYNRRVTGMPQLEARGLVGAFDFSLVKIGAARATTAR